MFEVSQEFKLPREAFHLAASYLDRVIASKPIAQVDFQLVGAACLKIAEGVTLRKQTDNLERATTYLYVTTCEVEANILLSTEIEVL